MIWNNTLKGVCIVTILGIFYPLYSNGQWVSRFNGQGDFSDKFNVIQISTSGDIYEAGSTLYSEQGRNLLLVKLNELGDTLWTSMYNGPGNGNDAALAMAIDNDGNIYTTGYQKGLGTGYDFITIKYSESGEILWSATYNYVSNEFDQSNSIAVDVDGNVYIAGQSDKDASIINNDDYVIIKYNSDGTTAWTKRTNGTGNSTDRPVKILINTDGNLIVTGRSDNLSDDDYMTLKYDASTGEELWRNYFDRTHHDRPTGMVIDESNGRIYITGRSNNGTNYDYATICYNTSGTLQWQSIYDYVDDDRATAIGIDGTGNIYVSGQSDVVASTIATDFDIFTLKYNSSGTQQWAQSWGGASSNDDIPYSIFVDDSGNSFITGCSDTDPSSTNISNDFVILKYNSTGSLQYNTTFSESSESNDIPSTIISDGSGNMYITGSSENIPDKNGTTIKLNSSGEIIWTKYYNGLGDNSDNSHAILKDELNNIYVAGYTLSYGADRNFLVMKLNSSGDVIWEKELNGTSTTQSTDDAITMTFDGGGNICVAGFVKNSGTGYDIKIAKFNTSGDTLWTNSYNYDAANETDKAVAIGVDGSNNNYITGRSDQDETIISNDDIVTLKYGSNGSFKWAQRYNGSGNGVDNAKSLRVTSAGNVYIAGKTFSGINSDVVVIKYDNLGAQQWVKKYDSGGDDECVNMIIDNDENVYLTGNSIHDADGQSDFITIKYNSDGALQWITSYDNSLHGNDDAKSIVLDESNNVIICGTSAPDTSSLTLDGDITTIKYDNSGNELWVKTFNGDGNDNANEVAIDSKNNIYTTGQTDNGTSTFINYDYITIQYDSDGNQIDLQNYNGTGNASDVANTIIAFDSTYYVSGGSFGEISQRDIVTILYGNTPVTISDINSAHTKIITSPNPFSTYTIIHLPEFLKEINKITIFLTDVSGNILQKKNIAYQPEFKIYNQQYPPGIYILNIIADNKLIYSEKINIQ